MGGQQDIDSVQFGYAFRNKSYHKTRTKIIFTHTMKTADSSLPSFDNQQNPTPKTPPAAFPSLVVIL
jgi:hypothetical protein